MSGALKPSDEAVLARIGRSPTGATAVDIARAHLGSHARRHSIASLNAIGLGVAARLVGLGLIEPTRSNNFRIAARLKFDTNNAERLRGRIATVIEAEDCFWPKVPE
jgi:hypothetical protein